MSCKATVTIPLPPIDERSLWSALIAHQGKPFETAHHLEFTYTIHNKEMFVSRKEKSITRSTVELAFHKVVELQAAGIPVDGPKMIGTFERAICIRV